MPSSESTRKRSLLALASVRSQAFAAGTGPVLAKPRKANACDRSPVSGSGKTMEGERLRQEQPWQNDGRRTLATAHPIFKTRGPLDPVTDGAICVPRPELDQLLRAAQAPTVDAYAAILSSRQTGKTTLLYQMRARLRPRGYGVALVDLAGVRDQAESELYRYFASQMLSELAPTLVLPRRRGRVREGVAPPLPTHPLEFRRFLLDTARQVSTPRLIVLVDEVEAVPEKYADAFFGTLRNVFSSRRKEDEAVFEKYLFVFSGARELHRLTSGPNSPLNIAERIYLQDLSLDGVRTLAANFERAAIAAPEPTAQWLYDQTGGHPYLTQKLCAQIEQWHPGVITQEIVERAAVQVLKSDDHLEKMILQVDAEPAARDLLLQILAGKVISFSRLQSNIARLELLGAIRDAGQCVVRNPIYYAALRAHFNLTGVAARPRRPFDFAQGKPWLRPLIAVLAILILLVNVPFLYNYTHDIVLATRSVNERFTPAGMSTNALIHYERILRANDPTPTTISVNLERAASAAPLWITFRPDEEDIVLDGTAKRLIDKPSQQERFAFFLNQSGLGVLRYYPSTDQRKIHLIFESQTPGLPSQTYTADFLVDYYSAFVFSAVVSLASFATSLGAIFGNVQRVRRVLRLLARFEGPSEE